MATIKLPNGEVLKTQSRRRYVLISYLKSGKPYIEKRSDSLDIVRKAQQAERNKGNFANSIIDTVTKGVIQ